MDMVLGLLGGEDGAKRCIGSLIVLHSTLVEPIHRPKAPRTFRVRTWACLKVVGM